MCPVVDAAIAFLIPADFAACILNSDWLTAVRAIATMVLAADFAACSLHSPDVNFTAAVTVCALGPASISAVAAVGAVRV